MMPGIIGISIHVRWSTRDKELRVRTERGGSETGGAVVRGVRTRVVPVMATPPVGIEVLLVGGVIN